MAKNDKRGKINEMKRDIDLKDTEMDGVTQNDGQQVFSSFKMFWGLLHTHLDQKMDAKLLQFGGIFKKTLRNLCITNTYKLRYSFILGICDCELVSGFRTHV